MSSDDAGHSPSSLPKRRPEDAFLIAAAAAGDRAAFSELMRRFDRLVRYTIFRTSGDFARRDPQWLDSVASLTWAGFARSIRRPDRPEISSLSTYLIQIARNQTLTEKSRAAKAAAPGMETPPPERSHDQDDSDPAAILGRFELLAQLRECLSELDEPERKMVSQIEALLGRRWGEAARKLGVAESTLRSRWPGFLRLIRERMQQKTGVDFAPDQDQADS